MTRSRRFPTALALVGAALLAAVAIVSSRARRLDRRVAARVDALLARAATPADDGAPADATVTGDDLADLPDPVRRYLEGVLSTDQPRARTVRMEQRGEFRVGDGPDAWKPFEATQHATVDPPGFVWDATVALRPFLPVRVVDAYEDGVGTLEAKLCSAIPVASAGPDPAMDEGELLRYLAEAAWYPTALLDGRVSWEAIDDRAAGATIEDGENAASIEYRFDERGLVESVHAEARYRQEDGDHAPWTGYFDDYEVRNCLLVPTSAEVEWNLPDGDRPYWRARIGAIEHRFVG